MAYLIYGINLGPIGASWVTQRAIYQGLFHKLGKP